MKMHRFKYIYWIQLKAEILVNTMMVNKKYYMNVMCNL